MNLAHTSKQYSTVLSATSKNTQQFSGNFKLKRWINLDFFGTFLDISDMFFFRVRKHLPVSQMFFPEQQIVTCAD